MKETLKKVIALLLMAVVVGVVFAFVFDFLQEENSQSTAETLTPATETQQPITQGVDNGLVDIVKKTQNSIVSINVEQNMNQYGRQMMGGGSGVVFKEDKDNYYIMTNNHVVDAGDYFSISLLDEERIDVELIAGDKDTDIAVLKLRKSDLASNHPLTVATLGDATGLVVGQPVLAIGNALGYGQSVTQGIISAVDRSLQDYRGNFAYKLIQTDAAINPGNSGGALVDNAGNVVGINVLKIADSQVEGVGFSIPINAALDISEALMNHGYLPVTYIGVSTANLNLRELDRLNIPKGVLVMEVMNNSPAKQAGIQPQDLITKVGDVEITSSEGLSYEIKSKNPGDQVILTIYRNEEILEIPVTLSEANLER